MRRVPPLLDFENEGGQLPVVVTQDVLEEERAARPEHAGDFPEGGQDGGEVVRGGAACHDAERGIPEGQGLDVRRQEADIGRALAPDEVARGLEHRRRQVNRDHFGREAGGGERRVAAARRDVEHALGSAPAPPGDEALEVLASRVAGAGDVILGALAELRLDLRLLAVAHAAGPFGRSARWRKRKSASRGVRSKRRLASSTSFTRSAGGCSRSPPSIPATARLSGPSPPPRG